MPIHEQVAGRVLTVTLDEPGVRNALDAAAMTRLREIFEGVACGEPLPPEVDTAGADALLAAGAHRPHAILLRATGRVFCAGAHLGEMKRLGQADYQTNLSAALDMGAMFRAVRNCPAPVVARVQGPCYGGGVGLVAACDLVVAGPDARFAFTEVRLGLVPGVIAPVVMDRLGAAATRAAFLTAEPLDPAAALARGLVDRTAATADELEGAVSELVGALLQGGPAALGLVKNLVDGVQTVGYGHSAELCAGLIARARTEAEGQAALTAFAAREPAPWADAAAWSPSPWPAETGGSS